MSEFDIFNSMIVRPKKIAPSLPRSAERSALAIRAKQLGLNLNMIHNYVYDYKYTPKRSFIEGLSDKDYLDRFYCHICKQVMDAFENKDADKFASMVDDSYAPYFLADNSYAIKKVGMLEKALLSKWETVKSSWLSFGDSFPSLLKEIDVEQMRAAGDPIPDDPAFELFRGVCSNNPSRFSRGISWTALLERAKYFARRWADSEKHSIVYKVVVPNESILCYTNDREEAEFLVALPNDAQLEIVWSEINSIA
jgi:hypothetical protein